MLHLHHTYTTLCRHCHQKLSSCPTKQQNTILKFSMLCSPGLAVLSFHTPCADLPRVYHPDPKKKGCAHSPLTRGGCESGKQKERNEWFWNNGSGAHWAPPCLTVGNTFLHTFNKYSIHSTQFFSIRKLLMVRLHRNTEVGLNTLNKQIKLLLQ